MPGHKKTKYMKKGGKVGAMKKTKYKKKGGKKRK
jgi:hypothetical protein|tara:strand:- start:525 stop:626 length:102 start_codon:yes stop_codon:yes gene_type:complete